MGYEALRAAVGGSFSIDRLNAITRLGHELLQAQPPVSHPSAAYAIAATAQKIAWFFDGYPPHDSAMASVEELVRPPMLAILDAAESGGPDLVAALDQLATAYAFARYALETVGSETGPSSSAPPQPFSA